MINADSDIFPADENRVINLLPDLTVNGEPRLLASVDMFNRTVTLGLILKRHDQEVLMVTFIIGVHDWVTLTTADVAGRLNQIDIFKVLVKRSQ
jgi:hypothetical protein